MSENGKTPRPTPRLKERYQQEIVALAKESGWPNVSQAPCATKIAVNIGLGEALTNSRAIEAATGDLAKMTGQRPVVTKARHLRSPRTIAREGMPIGAEATRWRAAYVGFLDRLISVVLRSARFPGHFAGFVRRRGNYSLGLREQLVFPRSTTIPSTRCVARGDDRDDCRHEEALGAPSGADGHALPAVIGRLAKPELSCLRRRVCTGRAGLVAQS